MPVFGKIEDRHDLPLLETIVIGLDRFLRPDLALDNSAHVTDDFEGLLGEVDLAAEEGNAGTVALRPGEKLESVAGRALRTAKNTDDQAARIERGKLLHGA